MNCLLQLELVVECFEMVGYLIIDHLEPAGKIIGYNIIQCRSNPLEVYSNRELPQTL